MIRILSSSIFSYFEGLLAFSILSTQPSIQDIRSVIEHPLDSNQCRFLSRPVSNIEIRNTMFSLATGKAPRPNGFNVEFFKATWDIIAPTVILAVQDFFVSGFMLRETNATMISLVPKISNAIAMNNFRPIACCNTIYKCITKIMANKLTCVLLALTNPPQNAFVKDCRISGNILLTQELFCGFHHEPFLPKCAIKVDFQKAYNTVDWDFLVMILQAFGFPDMFTKLIMTYIRTPNFYVFITRELHGFFF